MPPVLKPIRSYEGGDRPLDVYQIVKILPGRETQIWGYDSMIPGEELPISTTVHLLG